MTSVEEVEQFYDDIAAAIYQGVRKKYLTLPDIIDNGSIPIFKDLNAHEKSFYGIAALTAFKMLVMSNEPYMCVVAKYLNDKAKAEYENKIGI